MVDIAMAEITPKKVKKDKVITKKITTCFNSLER